MTNAADASRSALRSALDAVLLRELVGVVTNYIVAPPFRGRLIATWTIPGLYEDEVDYVRVADDGVHVVVAISQHTDRRDQRLDMYDLQGNKVATDVPHDGTLFYEQLPRIHEGLMFSQKTAFHPGDETMFVIRGCNHKSVDTVRRIQQIYPEPPDGRCGVSVLLHDFSAPKQLLFMPDGKLFLVHEFLPLFKVYE